MAENIWNEKGNHPSFWDKVKIIGKNIGKEDISKRQYICWARMTS